MAPGKKGKGKGKKGKDDEEEEEELPKITWSGLLATKSNTAGTGMNSNLVRVKLRSSTNVGRLRARKYDSSYKKGWAIQSNGYKAKRACGNCLKGFGPFKHCKGYKPESAASCGNCAMDRRTCRGGHFIHIGLPRSERSRLGCKKKRFGKSFSWYKKKAEEKAAAEAAAKGKGGGAGAAPVVGDDDEDEEDEDEEEEEEEITEEDWEGIDPPTDLHKDFDPFDSDEEGGGPVGTLGDHRLVTA